jgi:AcrR family transcriptional regulator
MGRPINADAEATRGRILASARQLFSDRGIGSTSMRKIASEAGVSVAMSHHYFGSKADLYHACVEGMHAELRELQTELEAAFRGAPDLSAVLEDAVRRTYSFARRHRPAVQLLMRTVLDTGALDSEHRDAVQLPFLERGAPLLASLLGQPVEQVRLTMLSITYLIVRFALNTPEEQARITAAPGADGAGVDDPDQAVADHLVAAARALLFMDSQ